MLTRNLQENVFFFFFWIKVIIIFSYVDALRDISRYYTGNHFVYIACHQLRFNRKIEENKAKSPWMKPKKNTSRRKKKKKEALPQNRRKIQTEGDKGSCFAQPAKNQIENE